MSEPEYLEVPKYCRGCDEAQTTCGKCAGIEYQNREIYAKWLKEQESKSDVKPYIQRFMEAVYGDKAALALASFSEEQSLTDAINRIAELEKALRDARKQIHKLKRGSCWCEAGIGRPGCSCGCKSVREVLNTIDNVLGEQP